jgi:hypothetical protein
MLVKERPILFSIPMVQAIDANLKTQTRRIVKVGINPKATIIETSTLWPDQGDWIAKFEYSPGGSFEATNIFKCPYGKVGDLLWVRETWREPDGQFIYKSNHWNADTKRWKPCIHMPKAASRVWLKNTNITAERVQQISDEDCQKEGVVFDPGSGYYFVRGTDIIAQSYYEGFQKLWIKVNGIESWESNPWVWVVDFEKTVKP